MQNNFEPSGVHCAVQIVRNDKQPPSHLHAVIAVLWHQEGVGAPGSEAHLRAAPSKVELARRGAPATKGAHQGERRTVLGAGK